MPLSGQLEKKKISFECRNVSSSSPLQYAWYIWFIKEIDVCVYIIITHTYQETSLHMKWRVFWVGEANVFNKFANFPIM